jgi:hypothetical protein
MQQPSEKIWHSVQKVRSLLVFTSNGEMDWHETASLDHTFIYYETQQKNLNL